MAFCAVISFARHDVKISVLACQTQQVAFVGQAASGVFGVVLGVGPIRAALVVRNLITEDFLQQKAAQQR
jgi:hypothetical protein